ncbi:MAG TPA: HI0074 family nucleotidyltransferase substrate-binding subunit [Stellaceae bacterium]|nr:HI0074 family nucleotidyltransferase substrate-binding subunit [Stellaceae bacterium]
MTLDITPLTNVVTRLREGLARYKHEPHDDQLRDGLIQRFDFTYELSHKMLRRQLSETAASPDEIATMAFPDLIRLGNAQGLLNSEWPVWRRFREMRTRTTHTYNATTAAEVAAAVPGFLKEAEHLLAELQKRNP